MSKWCDVRDAIIKHIDVETVTEKTKQDFVLMLTNSPPRCRSRRQRNRAGSKSAT